MLNPYVVSGILITCFNLAAAAAFAEPERDPADPLQGIDLMNMRADKSGYTATLADGRVVAFTVEPELQRYADGLFKTYEIPAGAAVVMNSRTGRILAFSQHRQSIPYADSPAVALDSSPPAASLFKIVTAAALFEQSDVTPATSTCYCGGGSRLEMEHLDDPPKDNRVCASMATALGRSINAIFARLSDQKLDRQTLQDYAARFGFNRELPFDVPLPRSTADIPGDRLQRARTAAGFWHTHVSPLHAALMVQSIAQNGAMLRPYIVDTVTDDNGKQIYQAKPKYLRHTVNGNTATALIKAMTTTVKSGTARKAFYSKRGAPYLPGIQVAGKTGTLMGSKPYRAYTWFAGIAPADKPEVAISVLVVNEPRWRIKASAVAARILKRYFELTQSAR